MNRIVVYRYQTSALSTKTASDALTEFTVYPQRANVFTTDFGVIFNVLTDAEPERVFQKLLSADLNSHFTLVELDDNNVPLITYSSAGVNVELNETEDDCDLDHDLIDDTMSPDQLKAELNMYLEKVQAEGLDSLNPNQTSRLRHLSQL